MIKIRPRNLISSQTNLFFVLLPRTAADLSVILPRQRNKSNLDMRLVVLFVSAAVVSKKDHLVRRR
jgi:hypothetical protein